MNGKSKVILLVLTMLFTVVLLIYMTFSWFDMVKETKPIIIYTGSLRLESSLYYATDSDKDGTIDDSEYKEVLSGGINFDRITPGEKYYFRLYVKNIGTIPGYLSVVINDLKPTKDLILQGFQVRYVDPTDPNLERVKEFTQHEDYQIVLLENVKLIKKEFFTFDFSIEVTEAISSQMRGQSITITNFLIGLDQIQKNDHP